MRNLLIIGPPRCGKTTLTQMIADKYPCEIIRGDAIEVTVCQSLIKDRLNESLKTENSIVTYPLLETKDKIDLYKEMYEQIKIDLRGNQKLIILEANNLAFSALEHEFGRDFIIYCLAMPDISVQDLANYIRLHDDLPDWTMRLGTASLEDCCKSIVDASIACKNTLKYFPKIKFFDTSKNRREKLQLIFEDIEKNLVRS